MKKFDQINVIPFIDIMLVLLAIVLVTATFISQGKINVNLPESSTATEQGDNTLTLQRITINKMGNYFLNDEPASLSDIELAVANWSTTQHVVLKIDRESQFNEFVQVGDILRQHDLTNVSIQAHTLGPNER